jgi:hypothetical protein
LLLVLLLVSGCANQATDAPSPVASAQYQGELEGLLVLDDQVLLTVNPDLLHGATGSVASVPLDDPHRGLRELPATTGLRDSECYLTAWKRASPDLITALERCNDEPGQQREVEVSVGEDGSTRIVRPMVVGGLVTGGVHFDAAGQVGVGGRGGQVCGGVYRAAPDAPIEPLDLDVVVDGNTIRLADTFDPDGDCQGVPLAQQPAIHPSGERLAVFVSGEATSRSGMDRLGSTYRLVVVGLDGRHPVIVPGEHHDPGATQFSPEGDLLAYSSDEGTWVVDPDDPEPTLVSSLRAHQIGWSEDNTTLVLGGRAPSEPFESGWRLQVIDLASLT